MGEHDAGTMQTLDGESVSGQQLGADMARILMTAVESTLQLEHLDKQVARQHKLVGIAATAGGYERLAELRRQQFDLEARLSAHGRGAQLLVAAGVTVRVTDKMSEEVVAEGKLISVRLARASLGLLNGDQESQAVVFAKPQTQTDAQESERPGMEMSVDIEVLSVPEDKTWIFEYGPSL